MQLPSPMQYSIDLNCDLGEGASVADRDRDAAMMAEVTSVNVACGGHAGDRKSMEFCVRAAKEAHLAVGAHPSYPDRPNFGRVDMSMPPSELTAAVELQILDLLSVCRDLNVPLSHIKPHGALYNRAAYDVEVARAIVSAIQNIGLKIAVFGLPGCELLRQAAAAGLRPIAELFLDRNYRSDGSLIARSEDGAMQTDPRIAAERLVSVVKHQRLPLGDGSSLSLQCQTACVHSDQSEPQEFVRAVKKLMTNQAITSQVYSQKQQ